ncbi:MAG: hypothetical protein O2979_02225 [Proteobacteria bacterium]|nr:hypothetical protein [Pseudomonadota bacterium]
MGKLERPGVTSSADRLARIDLANPKAVCVLHKHMPCAAAHCDALLDREEPDYVR